MKQLLKFSKSRDFHAGGNGRFPCLNASGGTALIIVLVMVVLVTILVLAYLAASTADRKMSNSSVKQTISDQLARSAADVIIGDLKEEIFTPGSGSGFNNIITVGPSGAQTTISIPEIFRANTFSTMLPTRNPPFGGVTTIPNLVRVSVRSDPIVTPGVGSRASAASSATASLNNRSVTPKRWNAHYLIPLKTPGSSTPISTPPDSTPADSANFPTPDWVFIVANQGPTVITAPSSNVIGRYAYAVYDEGGLLDVNVAGGPSTISSNQAANKSSLALIDLTKLLDSSGKQLIPSVAVDALVGWRNYASLQSNFTSGGTDSISGQFPSGFIFSANNATDFFYNFGRGSSSAYLKANNLASSSLTDQLFLSRQQLISMQAALQQTVGFSPSALQYLTTFSRGLDQPSYAPNPNRPKTVSYSGDPALAGTNGSNTASGNDDTINPSFLTVRAGKTQAAGRNDGSDITMGEPLVKKRFALNRLAWLTYKGPIADGKTPLTTAATTALMVNKSDPDLTNMAQLLHDNYGLSYAFLQKGTAANVYNYFGLSWVADSRPNSLGNGEMKWLYNHSLANGAGPFTSIPSSGGIISHLQDLASQSPPREPDFFELLKAGIVAGSKGRMATQQVQFTGIDGKTVFSTLPNPDDYQNKMDASLEFHIIQIGANIIEQAKLDGFTTQILYNDGSITTTREISSAENLPYLYGTRMGLAQGAAPVIANPAVPTKGNYAFPFVGYPNAPAPASTITDPGYEVALQFPVIWNPHDQHSLRCAVDSSGKPLTDSTGSPLFPTNFRIVADSTDPDDIQDDATTPPSNYQSVLLKVYNSPIVDTSGGNATTYPGDASTAAPKYNALSSPFASSSLFTSFALSKAQPFAICAESSAMTFNINEASSSVAQTFFREPTILLSPDCPPGSGLAQGGASNCLNPKVAASANNPSTSLYPSLKNASYMDMTTGALVTTDINAKPSLSLNNLMGFFIGVYPGAYYCNYTYTDKTKTPNKSTSFTLAQVPSRCAIASGPAITYRMQYQDKAGKWVTYDSKYIASLADPAIYPTTVPPAANCFTYLSGTVLSTGSLNGGYDPRTSRFGMPFEALYATPRSPGMPSCTAPKIDATTGAITAGIPWQTTTASTFGWLRTIADRASGATIVNNEIMTERPDYSIGYQMGFGGGAASVADAQFPMAKGWVLNNNSNYHTFFGLYSQNNPIYVASNTYEVCLTQNKTTVPFDKSSLTTSSQYYFDPDGVVRRAMGAYFTDPKSASSVTPPPGYSLPDTYPGLPMATASTIVNNTNQALTQAQSRPIILHRPFRSVAELGYVFSGTPWKNLDFFTPESGDAPLLDIFCIDDSDNINGVVAGKVNLNTQQVPVLQAILTGAYKDEEAGYAGNYNPSSSTYSSGYSPLSAITGATASTEANLIANALVARTSGGGAGYGPLVNISDLVGRYTGDLGFYNTYGQPYDGFSGDLKASVFANNATSAQIQRFREAPIRTLAAVGQTRVWNLMIDVIAQTGRFPVTASKLDDFYVDGEQRYWVHVAIDRFTGQVIDKQIEVVRE